MAEKNDLLLFFNANEALSMKALPVTTSTLVLLNIATKKHSGLHTEGHNEFYTIKLNFCKKILYRVLQSA